MSNVGWLSRRRQSRSARRLCLNLKRKLRTTSLSQASFHSFVLTDNSCSSRIGEWCSRSNRPGIDRKPILVNPARCRIVSFGTRLLVAGEKAYLDNAIGRYSPKVASTARAGLKKLRSRFPGARQLAHEGRRLLPIGFAPAERESTVF